MNPNDRHIFVSDLTQLGLTMFDPSPVAANQAISFAPAATGYLPNNADDSSATQSLMAVKENSSPMYTSIDPNASGVEHALRDEIPTPEQMWGQGK